VHNPKQNSTSFSYAADGRFNCFSCNAKGRGAIDLAMAIRGVGFQAAVELLGAVPIVEPPKQKSPVAVNSDATELKPLEKDTWRKFAVPCPWLEARMPDAAIREKYGVFCYNNPARKSAYSGRVMLPVKDSAGLLYGYLGRDSSGNPDIPKYLFPKNLPKSRFLFGAWELSKGLYLPSCRQGEPHTGALPLKVVYLLESPFAVMHFASLGLPALAAYGWSVSEEQIALLASLTRGIVYIPDRNKYQECEHTTALIGRRLWVKAPPLPAGIDDPEQMTLEQIQALTH
jgi:DNA primase